MFALVPQPSSRNPRLTVEIVTPERVVIRDAVAAMSLPTPEGMISILPQHVPYVGALAPGAIHLRKDPAFAKASSFAKTTEDRSAGGPEETILAVSGGVVEVRDGIHVRVLVETAERAEEIDVVRAEEARKRAAELRHRVRADDEAFATASAALEKELARLRVARRARHRGHHGVSRGAL